MRPKSMILILIALGCGLIASIGISQVIERGSGEEEVEMQQIYVAVEDINIGAELTAQRVKLENWPIDRIPIGAITTAEQLDGQAPRQPLFAGEPILVGKITNSEDLISASHRIKPGHRVMSVKVSMDTAVSHLIQPGDHVDILAFIQGRRGHEAKAETILDDIEVFAINDQFSRHSDQDDGGSIQAKTVSLQVTPEQANGLVYFAEQGRLRLTLRSPDEKSVGGSSFGGSNPSPRVEPTRRTPEVPQVASIPPNGFHMQILDGTGSARIYAWDDKDEESLPTEITEDMGSSNPESDFIMPPFGGTNTGADAGAGEETAAEVVPEAEPASERRRVQGFEF